MKLEQQLAEATRHFWATRRSQVSRQGESGDPDRGFRAAVTGGAQMDGYVKVLVGHLLDAGVPQHCIITSRKGVELPGYFRPTKDWDLLVIIHKQLVGALEFKSQCGPSFGNNFNNRTEEALGNATDLWTAYREGAFRASPRPWLGYMMLLEEAPGSMCPVKVKENHFQVFPEFRNASYAGRYGLLCERLARERLYDATCLMLTNQQTGPDGAYFEPSNQTSFRGMLASLLGKVTEFQTMNRL